MDIMGNIDGQPEEIEIDVGDKWWISAGGVGLAGWFGILVGVYLYTCMRTCCDTSTPAMNEHIQDLV